MNMGTILFFMLLNENDKEEKIRAFQNIILNKKFAGDKKMEEVIKSFIDKDVEITTFEGGIKYATIKKYCDGWIIYTELNDDSEKALNCNYIITIEPSEYMRIMREKKQKKAEKKMNKGF